MISCENVDIRLFARECGIPLRKIAKALNISEPTVYRILNKKLSDNYQKMFVETIENIACGRKTKTRDEYEASFKKGKESKKSPNEMSEAAKEARRKYFREYSKRNKEKRRQWNANYWEKVAAKNKEGGEL